MTEGDGEVGGLRIGASGQIRNLPITPAKLPG